MAGVADRKRGWGVEGDTFEALAALRRLGVQTWFTIGDRDLATCMARTEMLRAGRTLTESTEAEARSLRLRCRVLPVTDDAVETRVKTPDGDLHLQEFWVRERGEPKVSAVRFKGASKAKASPQVRAAFAVADRIIVCPANPVTSIGPMVAIPGFRRLLSDAQAPKVAVSPMVGEAPFSGPAGKLLRATGARPDSAGVAELYRSFLDAILISRDDSALKPTIEAGGPRCVLTDTLMPTREAEVRLAREALRV